MTEHNLKTWPEHFKDVSKGHKTFELRKNDRDYKVGDILWLEEYLPEEKKLTGHYVKVEVTHILHEINAKGFGLAENHVIMSFKKISFGFTKTREL